MEHPRIDAVPTNNEFHCSTCRATRGGDASIVVRIVAARPDHPPEVESVDLLLCTDCLDAAVRAAKAAMGAYLSDELQQLNAYIGRAGAFRRIG